jgi:hypothetical protein
VGSRQDKPGVFVRDSKLEIHHSRLSAFHVYSLALPYTMPPWTVDNAVYIAHDCDVLG